MESADPSLYAQRHHSSHSVHFLVWCHFVVSLVSSHFSSPAMTEMEICAGSFDCAHSQHSVDTLHSLDFVVLVDSMVAVAVSAWV